MNLKDLAKSKGTNIKKLSESCGVSPSTIYAIASGDTNVDNVGIDLFLKISKALGMSAEDLRHELSSDVICATSLLEDQQTGIEPVNKIRELVDVCSRLDDSQIDLLIATARNFAVANEKDAARDFENVGRPGIAVM